MQPFSPLKRFGQNYLQDQNIIKKIIEEINPKKDDSIIEIGPGRGALTKHLLSSSANFSAVEIDTRAVGYLQNTFPSLKLHDVDFLKVNLNDFFSGSRLRIVGNIPYNITSPIIFKMLEERKIVNDSVLMVQEEVARRITAKQGTKDWGILSVILNYFGEVKYCFKVSSNVFYPKPKVDSAVIHIYFSKEMQEKIDDKNFIKIVKASFGNRRKTLKNSLKKSIFREYNFSESGVDLSLRAEQLSINDFVKLTRIIQQKL